MRACTSTVPIPALMALALLAATPALSQQLDASMCPMPGSQYQISPPELIPWTPGAPAVPMLRVTVSDPAAVCNDGSPAVYYIRPAGAAYPGNPVTTASDDWLVFLDGGGGCRDADQCLWDRWCGQSANNIYDVAGKMSSLGTPLVLQSPRGIFDLAPVSPTGTWTFTNAFAAYNHVYVHYCSSDNWIGSGSHAGIVPTTGTPTPFDIEFQGEAIVNAVLAELMSGTAVQDPGTEQAYVATLPLLADADRVVIAGESAGGVGVRHHLDRLARRLQIASPEVEVLGVVDAAAQLRAWKPYADWGNGIGPATYADYLLTEVAPAIETFWQADPSALDHSCLRPIHAPAHAAADGVHPQICYDTTYTLFNHVTTPTFIRTDLDDPKAYTQPAQYGLVASVDELWARLATQVADYAAEVDRVEPMVRAPGAFGPFCGSHVAIRFNGGFFATTVVPHPLFPYTALSFHDLVEGWVNATPGAVVSQVQQDFIVGPTYPTSICY